MRKKALRYLVIAVVCICAAFLLLFSLLWVPAVKERLSRRTFDLAAWQEKEAHSASNPVRLRMVDDLLGRYGFVGMKRQDVVRLLGEPDDTQYFKNWDMVYWLGPERGVFSVDSEWLVLRHGSDNTITEVRVVTD